MSQRFLRYTISPRVLILPAGRYSTGYYAAGGGEQCGLYGENASIAFLIRNPRGRAMVVVMVVHYHQHPPVRCGAARCGGEREYAVLVNVSPRTDLTWLAIIK